jgi:putative transcriptional regulator
MKQIFTKVKATTKKKPRSQILERHSTVGDDILHGLRELVETIQAGGKPQERFKVRVVEIPEPTPHTAGTVRAIRQRLGVSQAAFAKLVGVSTILAQGWEQGVRTPSPLAARLLDTIAVDPAAWLSMVQRVHQRPAKRAG